MKKLFFLCFIFLLTGCNFAAKSDDQPLYMGSNKVIDQTKADEAKQIILSMEEVIAVKAVEFEEDIFVAAQVKQFDRFFLDQIRKKAHEKIKKRYPETQVHVSTDKKVFLELEKLEEEIYHNKIKKAEIKKKWKKIEDFMKG